MIFVSEKVVEMWPERQLGTEERTEVGCCVIKPSK